MGLRGRTESSSITRVVVDQISGSTARWIPGNRGHQMGQKRYTPGRGLICVWVMQMPEEGLGVVARSDATLSGRSLRRPRYRYAGGGTRTLKGLLPPDFECLPGLILQHLPQSQQTSDRITPRCCISAFVADAHVAHTNITRTMQESVGEFRYREGREASGPIRSPTTQQQEVGYGIRGNVGSSRARTGVRNSARPAGAADAVSTPWNVPGCRDHHPSPSATELVATDKLRTALCPVQATVTLKVT